MLTRQLSRQEGFLLRSSVPLYIFTHDQEYTLFQSDTIVPGKTLIQSWPGSWEEPLEGGPLNRGEVVMTAKLVAPRE